MKSIPECMFHSRSLACKKPYGAAPAGEKIEFAAYPRREQGISHMTLWVEEDEPASRSISDAVVRSRRGAG